MKAKQIPRQMRHLKTPLSKNRAGRKTKIYRREGFDRSLVLDLRRD
jgi:hypothetical protein